MVAPPPSSGMGGAGGDQKNRQFKVMKFLGKGSYGSVFLVQRMLDNQTYALKEMDVKSMSQAEREDSINEIRLLASVSHPNVIAYNEAFLDGNRLCIIMEYAPDGDLAKIIKKQQMMKRPIHEDQIWRYFIQVVQGIQALHGMRILHRDIKPGNIMVMENGVCKVGDLGIAKLLTKTAAAKTQIGTPHYMPPEVWKNRPYGFSSDTWAIGCLLFELACLNVPFEARSMSELRYKVLRGTYPPISGGYSRDLAQVVRDCLDPNPDKRPSMDAIMAMPAITSRMHMLPSSTRNPPPTAGSSLIETIKVPRGNIQAIKNKLPPANYASNMMHLGNGGGGAQNMATIDEDGDMNDISQPAALPVPGRHGAARPQQAAPKPAFAGPAGGVQSKLPQLNVGVGGQQQQQQQQAPPPPSALQSYLQKQIRTKPNDPHSHHGSESNSPAHAAVEERAPAWFAPQSKQSESHASYGAFYHQAGGFTPKGQQQAGRPQSNLAPAPAPWQQQAADMWKQHQHQQQHQQQQDMWRQQQQQYASPYVSPYGGQQQRPDVRLPQLGGQAAAGMPKAHAAAAAANAAAAAANAAAAAAAAAGGAAGKLPPWNYGGVGPKQRGSPQRAAGGNGGVGRVAGLPGVAGAGAAGGDVQRYPPPQWAPKPARW